MIFPSPPGGITLSNRATQLPQPGMTFLIFNSDVPTFFMMKVWLKSLLACSKSIGWFGDLYDRRIVCGGVEGVDGVDEAVSLAAAATGSRTQTPGAAGF